MKKEEEKRLNKNSSLYIPPEQGKKLQLKTGKEFVHKSVLPSSPIFSDKKIKNPEEFRQTLSYIQMFFVKDKREEAYKKLNDWRDIEPNIAVLLWHTTGTIAILLQEIISIYPFLANQKLNQKISEKICNVLGLFQCIALDPKTRPLFLKANLHLYVYPLINSHDKRRPYEHLRVTSLGVIGALVKDDPESIKYLVKTELIVLCLRIMKKGDPLSKSVATFIVLKILTDNNGLSYVCQTTERYNAVAQILKVMIEELDKKSFNGEDKQEKKMYQRIVRCFLRLSENMKANETLKKFIPQSFIQGNQLIKEDK